jgi:hypothetical protein
MVLSKQINLIFSAWKIQIIPIYRPIIVTYMTELGTADFLKIQNVRNKQRDKINSFYSIPAGASMNNVKLK